LKGPTIPQPRDLTSVFWFGYKILICEEYDGFFEAQSQWHKRSSWR
jgi:hypothetical protein